MRGNNFLFYEQQSFEQLTKIEQQKIINTLSSIYQQQQSDFSDVILTNMLKIVFFVNFPILTSFLLG